MQIIRHWDELVSPPTRTVLTIGNFDGVHLGHRAVFEQVVRQAHACQGTPAVYTFAPHPLKLLRPEAAPLLITTPEEKQRLIAASGIQLLLCPEFDRATASMSAADFVRNVLVKTLALHHLVVGADYAFGRGREGDVAFLEEMGRHYGFTVQALTPVRGGETVCSSTRIRTLIQKGEVDRVVPLLGRQFSLAGTVVGGDKRGRRLGFPTANLATTKELLPAPGVYAVKAVLGDVCYDAVANVGRKPTYGGHILGVEVHLLDFSGDLYGRELRIFFFDRLRAERAFPSSAELQAAIAADVRQARDRLADRKLVTYQSLERDDA